MTVGHVGRPSYVGHAAIEIGVANHDRREVFACSLSESAEVRPAVVSERHRSDGILSDTDTLQIRVDRLPVMRVDTRRDEYPLAAGEPLGHENGLGCGARPVVHRRVGDRQPQELAHDRLKFENRLQRALRDLGLVGGVRRIEFAAQEQLIDRRGDRVIVGASAEKASELRSAVLARKLVQVSHEARLVERCFDGERPSEADLLGNLVEELVDRRLANGGKHRRDLFFRVR